MPDRTPSAATTERWWQNRFSWEPEQRWGWRWGYNCLQLGRLRIWL